jgi:phenylpyruvate tautomerase PptA (4-oxalocrotonate tautomerase family)
VPMIDAFIPAGALKPEAEERLMKEITDTLIRLEGLDPSSERVQAVSVIFLHRPTIFVAGTLAGETRYRFIPSVPEGQYDDETRALIVREITAAVARAEGISFDAVSPRVWVFPNEIVDGGWGGRGGIRRLPDILALLAGEKAGRAAGERLASKRRNAALAILRTALDAVR